MIYAIMNGSYSDMTVEGYVKTEGEAERYCAYMNNKEEYDDWWYEGISELIEEDTSNVKYEIHACVIAEKEADKWNFYLTAKELRVKNEVKEVCVKDDWYHPAMKKIELYVKENTTNEKILKIAQDYFYQWLYEKKCKESEDAKFAEQYMESFVNHYKKK